jgi:hypothetical protein
VAERSTQRGSIVERHRAAVPNLDGARESATAGYVSGGTRRNLEWVGSHTDFGSLPEVEQLLLVDVQTSGGLLVVGNCPGARWSASSSGEPSTTSSCVAEPRTPKSLDSTVASTENASIVKNE